VYELAPVVNDKSDFAGAYRLGFERHCELAEADFKAP
jgi:hypothetical protein